MDLGKWLRDRRKQVNAIGAQLNMRDNGQTYNTVRQAQSQPLQNRAIFKPRPATTNELVERSYGSGAKGTFNRLFDVVNPNTEADRIRRFANSGLNESFYAEQDRKAKEAMARPDENNGTLADRIKRGVAKGVAGAGVEFVKAPYSITKMLGTKMQEDNLINNISPINKTVGKGLEGISDYGLDVIEAKKQQSSIGDREGDNEWAKVAGAGPVSVAAIMANPTAAITAYSANTGAQQYDEARNAGKSINEANEIAAMQAAKTAALERITGKIFSPADDIVRGVGPNVLKAIKNTAYESGQEVAEQFTENLITNKTYNPNQGLTENFAQAALGGLTGGVTGSVINQVQNPRPLQETGIQPQPGSIRERIQVAKENVKQSFQQVAQNEGGYIQLPSGQQINEPLYHGSPNADNIRENGFELRPGENSKANMYGNGIYLTNENDRAQLYSGDGSVNQVSLNDLNKVQDSLRSFNNSKVLDVDVPKNAKIYKVQDVIPELFSADTNYGDPALITKKYQDLGYDGIEISDESNVKGISREVVIFDPKKLKVKQDKQQIHPEDQNEMSDFIDYARGVYKPPPEVARQLEIAAADIAERYNIKMPNSVKKLATVFDKELQKQGFNTSKSNKKLNEGGYIRIPQQTQNKKSRFKLNERGFIPVPNSDFLRGYHQTDKAGKKSILNDGPSNNESLSTWEILPRGLNTKDTSKPLKELSKAGYNEQVELYLPKTANIKEFESRSEATSYIASLPGGQEYKDILKQIGEVSQEQNIEDKELEFLAYLHQDARDVAFDLLTKNGVDAIKIKNDYPGSVMIDKDGNTLDVKGGNPTDNTIVLNTDLLQNKKQINQATAPKLNERGAVKNPFYKEDSKSITFKPDTKKTYKVYRGSGGNAKVQAAEGVNALGKNSVYYAFDRKTASRYGDVVTESDITLTNPYILKTYEQFTDINAKAGNTTTSAVEAGNGFPNTIRKYKLIEWGDNLVNYLKSQGYDGLVDIIDSSNTRKQYNPLDHDQIVVFDKSTPKPKIINPKRLFDRQDELTEHSFPTDRTGTAIEHAGDIYRELAKSGGNEQGHVYVSEKIYRIKNYFEQSINEAEVNELKDGRDSVQYNKEMNAWMDRLAELEYETTLLQDSKLKQSMLDTLELQRDIAEWYRTPEYDGWRVDRIIENVNKLEKSIKNISKPDTKKSRFKLDEQGGGNFWSGKNKDLKENQSPKKTTRLAKRAKTANEISPTLQKEIKPKTYEVSKNDKLVENSKKFVNKGYKKAAVEISARLDSKDAGNDPQTVSDAISVIKKLDEKGNQANYQQASELVDKLSEQLTRAGQTVQAASLLYNRTPQGLYYSALRTLKKAGVEVTPEIQKKLQDKLAKVKSTKPGTAEGDLARHNFIEQVNKIVPSKTSDKAVQIWKAGLLSGPITTMGNLMGNTMEQATKRVYEDPVATGVDVIMSVFTGKRSKSLTGRGVVSGGAEGVVKGVSYFKTGYDPRNPNEKFDVKNIHFSDTKKGKAAEIYTQAVFRSMGAADQAFFYGSLRNSLYDQAITDAKNLNLKGKARQEHIKKFITEPSKKALQLANDEARYDVFQNKTRLGEAASGLKNKTGAIGEFIIPFSGVPSSIATRIIERTPIGTAIEVTKQMKSGKFDQRRMSQAIARGTTGVVLIGIGKALAEAGRLTLGFPEDDDERKLWQLEGRQPFSVNIGGKWRSMNYFQPAGTLIAAGGQYFQAKKDGASESEALSKAGFATAKAFSEQSFLQGVSGVINAINRPDQFASQFLEKTAGSIVPNFIGAPVRSNDDTQREINSPIDAIASRLPYARETLIPKDDQFGVNLDRQSSGINTLLNPTRPSDVKPLDNTGKELRRLQDNDLGISTPTINRSVFGDDKITPKQIAEMRGSIYPKIKTAWDNIIKDSKYQSMTDEDKHKALRDAKEDIWATGKKEFAAKYQVREFGQNADPNKNYDLTKTQKALIQGNSDYSKYLSQSDVDIPQNINATARTILESPDLSDSEWLKKPNTDNDVKNTLRSWLPQGVEQPPITNEVAKDWAYFEKKKAEGSLGNIEEQDEKKKILRTAYNSQLNEDERDLYKLSKSRLQDAIDSNLITSRNIENALRVEKQLYDAGLIEKETLAYKLGMSSRGRKGRSRGSGKSKTDKSIVDTYKIQLEGLTKLNALLKSTKSSSSNIGVNTSKPRLRSIKVDKARAKA